MKDYYSILECTPMSTRDEIKRNYRRLAQQFHPDKNADDIYATARFHDIREAYETLTQPEKKNAWLQERWLRQAMNKHMGESVTLTPYLILDKVLKTEKYMSAADIFRMDQFGMIKQLTGLISDENRECLLNFNEPEVTKTIIRHLLASAHPFPLSMLKEFMEKLELLAKDDPESRSAIQQFRKALVSRQNRERYTLPLILLATIIICVIIYFSAKR
jgi:curved DNA-binding protein CbpA